MAHRRPRVCAVCAYFLALSAGAVSLDLQRSASLAHRPTQPTERNFEGTVKETRVSGGTVFAVLEDVAAIDGLGPISRRVSVAGEVPFANAIDIGGEFRLDHANPGDRLRVRARLRAPRTQSNPAGRDEVRDFERAGIGAVGNVERSPCCIRLPEREGVRWLAGFWRMRRETGERLEELGEGGGLLRALALGDRRGLSAAKREAFARLGLAHLLAVSGLHLSLVASLGFAFLRQILRRSVSFSARHRVDIFALAFAGAVALTYALLAGWGVPIRRALIFLIALALATAFGRPGARFHPLAMASLVVLCSDPGALFSAGAQLSFAACAALLAAGAFSSEGDEDSEERARGILLRALLQALRISAVAIAATAPLAAWHMGRVAPFGLVANLIAIPWTAFVLLPASLGAAMLSQFPDHAIVSTGLEAAALVARSTQWGIDTVARHVPAIHTAHSPGLGSIFFALLLGVAVVRARKISSRIVLVLLQCGLLATAPASRLGPPPPRAIGFDVGQGDAMLIQGRSGAVLIDAGAAIPGRFDRGRSQVVPALLAAGVRRLDLLLATHADLDHRGGIPAVLEALVVDELWVPFGAEKDEGFDSVFEAARRHDVRVVEKGQGSAPIRIGDLAIAPLWPPPGDSRASRNNRSLVVRAEFGGVTILLAGDLERAGEEALIASGANLRAEVLELPHHGSRTSSTTAFLDAVGASVGLVSAPCYGRFGMPHRSVVQRAERAGLTIWWTGRDGAIWLSPERGEPASEALKGIASLPGFAVWGHAQGGPRCALIGSMQAGNSSAMNGR